MSESSYLPHPEDPSLITIDSKRSQLLGDVQINALSVRLQKLARKNEKLQERLASRDSEIRELKERNEKINNALSMVSLECSPEQSQKIADLSKTNRHLSAQLMAARTKARELEGKNGALEKTLEELRERENEKRCEEEAPLPRSPSEHQLLAENLDKTRKKLFEASNLNVQLKNELKMAHKCLQQELGVDTVNLPQILNGISNWRGRADQISMLQRKLAEYRERLEGTDFDSMDSSRTSLRQLDSVRRSEIDALTKELDECRSELEGVRQKIVGLKNRNKILLDEGNSYKLKTLELMEKSKNDDDYIKCLNEKIAMAKFECEHKMSEVKKEAAQVERLKEETRVEVQRLNAQLQNAAEALSEKSAEIESLKAANKELENSLRDVSGDFLFSCRDMSRKKFVDLVQGLEQEKASLTAMVQSFNDRLSQQIVLQNDQHDVITKQKIKISRLEAKVKEFEVEKAEMQKKHRRHARINEYSRSMCGISQSTSKSTSKSEISEVDRLKFRLEFATERISYLENKMKELNDDRNEDLQKFAQIIGKSKDIFQELYKGTGDGDGVKNESSCVDSVIAIGAENVGATGVE